MVIVQVISMGVIIISNKTDIKWITQIQQEQGRRILALEEQSRQ
jgi:hypothetical protein